MKFRIEVDMHNHVIGFANSSSSAFEAIALSVTHDKIKCQTSTAIPTNHAEEYIELYAQVLEHAKRLQDEINLEKPF